MLTLSTLGMDTDKLGLGIIPCTPMLQQTVGGGGGGGEEGAASLWGGASRGALHKGRFAAPMHEYQADEVVRG